MNSVELQRWVTDLVSTLAFSWTQLKPEMLQTVHRLALASSPATALIQVPFDLPVHDLVTGTIIRPSEMQSHLTSVVVPSFLPAIQSVAEDALNDHFGDDMSIFARVERLVATLVIDRSLASRAHHWRIARNVVTHGGGVVTGRLEKEVADLIASRRIDFSSFTFWGPLLDAGHGGVPVPITDRAVANPDSPCPSISVPIVAGTRIEVGMADLLAAAKLWAAIIVRVCGV